MLGSAVRAKSELTGIFVYGHLGEGGKKKTHNKKTMEGGKDWLNDICFHSHPGRMLNGRGGLEGMLTSRRDTKTAAENICSTAGEEGLCSV